MSYEEYWFKDPWLTEDYRKAWELKQKADNYNAWLQGLYNYKAVGVVLYNSFKEKGKKAENYFDKPVEFKEEERRTPKQIRQEVYNRLKGIKEQWDARNKA